MALKLSALDGTNGFRIEGIDAVDLSGQSVSGAGDVNGDGFGDIIIGAYQADPSGRTDAGETYVVFGSSVGFGASLQLSSLDGTNGFRIDGINAGDFSGHSVSCAGDVNGDGIDDILIGARQAGETYMVFGSSAGFGATLDLTALDGTNGFRLYGVGGQSGYSVSGAGDVNGDGVDDVIIGAPWAAPDGRYIAGETYVVFGSPIGFGSSLDLTALDGTNGFRLDGIDELDVSGYSASRAGDVNGDGIDDIIVGAPGANPGSRNSAGETYVVFGSSKGFGASLKLSALDGRNGFRIAGIDPGDRSGVSVSSAGDVNGDGIDDMLVGANYADPDGRYNAGETYVVFGSSAGFGASLQLAALDGTNGFRIDGTEGQSGLSVSDAGDVNGDGVDDILVGASWATGAERDLRGYVAGETYVVFGSSAGFGASLELSALDGANGFRLDGIDAGDYSGSPVSGAGDVNGDGVDDILVGAYQADPGGRANAGETYVIYGSASLGGVNDAPVAADDVLDVGVGEVDLAANNGNGADRDPDLDDFVITSIEGQAVTVGDTVTLASGLAVTAVGAARVRLDAPGLALGATASASFAYTITDARGLSDAATVTLDFRKDAIALSALDGTNGFRLYGMGGESFRYVSDAGDVNGDGVDDFLVGVPEADPDSGRGSAGETYVVFGSSAGFGASLQLSMLDGTNGFRVDGIDYGDNSGVSVSGVGDVNGDGIDDILVGANGADPGGRESAGETYVVFGSAAGFGASLQLSALGGTNGFRIDGIDADDLSGHSVSGAGDVNGDGIDDILVAAGSASPGGAFRAGETYVVFGSSAGFGASLQLSMLDGTNGFRVDGIDYGDNSGVSVSGAGDVNGDGIDDILIGASGGDPGERSGAGETYVVFGSSVGFGASLQLSALDGTNGFRIDGIDAEDHSGHSVSGAGDVNGDGIDDIIVGAPGADPGNRNSAGETYVVFGSSAGFGASLDLSALDGTNGFRLAGIRLGDRLGSVSGAGDVNGDGIDDILVGAYLASPGEHSRAGETYVVFGSSAGFGASLQLSALDGTNGFRIDGIDANDFSGHSVSGAGDINGDGFDDILIGAYASGETYVVFGSPSADAGSVPPVLSGDLVIEVDAGMSVPLSSDDLSIVAGPGAAGATFVVLATTAGHVALAGDPETPVEQFTRRDIEENRVLFVHDGSAGESAGFEVEAVGPTGLSSGSASVTASVTPGEGGGGAGFPIAVDDKVFAVEDAPRTVLASALLANDLSIIPGDLVIEAVYGALNGAVAFDADGNVVFTPAADFAGIGGFGYRVVDSFGDVAEGLVEVEITAEDDAPRATDADFGSVRADARVAGLVTTTPSLPTDIAVSTLATDPDSALGPQSFAFVGASIDGAAATLTQAGVTYDAATGAFAFDPTGVAAFRALRSDESASVVVRFTVSDGALADQGTARFTVLGTNAAPVLSGDFALMMREGGAVALTTDDLSGTDAESGPDGLTFTVANAINGAVLLNGAATSRFTQADLDAGRVAFAHDGSETDAASFDVVLTDGEGASLSAQTVSAAVALAPDNTILARVGGTGTTDAPPQFEILADGASLGVFAIAQPVVRAPVDFEYFLVESDGAAPDTVTVRFLNDGWPGGVDRNLWVDYIEVNGARLEAETEGAYVLKNGLFVGARERLFTNGDLVFANLRDDPETDATTVVVRAGGTGTDAAPAQFRVTIDGADFGIFAVTNPAATNRDFVYDSFVFEIAAPSVSRVEIAFLNDGRSDGIDRNLWVDYVAVNDVAHHAEIEGIYIRDNGADLGARQSMYWNGTLTFDDLWA